MILVVQSRVVLSRGHVCRAMTSERPDVPVAYSVFRHDYSMDCGSLRVSLSSTSVHTTTHSVKVMSGRWKSFADIA